jgi:hypothetical protein
MGILSAWSFFYQRRHAVYDFLAFVLSQRAIPGKRAFPVVFFKGFDAPRIHVYYGFPPSGALAQFSTPLARMNSIFIRIIRAIGGLLVSLLCAF